MSNRRSETKPEVALRSAIHKRGLRFRKDYRIRAGSISVKADIVFVGPKVAVFVDGCFWHCCPEHGSSPKTNSDYWSPKLAANVKRDRKVDAELCSCGWTVLRIWEHEDSAIAARRIEEIVSRA